MKVDLYFQRKFLIFWAIACMLMLVVLQGCGSTRRVPGSGSFRGNAIFFMQFPVENRREDGLIEYISVNTERRIVRTYSPKAIGTNNIAIVPENTWIALEQIHEAWCQDPPRFVALTPREANFEVSFRCLSGSVDPTYYIAPSDLPQPLRELIDLVPSTEQH